MQNPTHGGKHADGGCFSPLNYLNIRLEYLTALVLTAVLVLTHLRDINWLIFVLAFLYIDLIGYIPGLIRVFVKKSAYIEKPFYYAYNTTHSFVTAIPIAVIGWYLIDARWSLLAIFLHLFGDRALLNNYTKDVNGPFEHYTPKAPLDRAGDADATRTSVS